MPSDPSITREQEGSDQPLRIGIVSNFERYKGVLDFIEAARICVNDYELRCVRFEIIGDSQRARGRLWTGILKAFRCFHDSKQDALRQIEGAGLGDALRLRGFVAGAAEIFSQLDVVCFPSHLDAVGRPVFEGAMYGLPSVVALRNLRDHDSIIHGETGLIVPEKDPHALAEAFRLLASNRELVRRLGANARRLAETRFDVVTNAARLLDLYREVVSRNHKEQRDAAMQR